MTGTLYLIPTPIGGPNAEAVIPAEVLAITRKIEHFVVEELRTARRYLSSIGVERPIAELQLAELNEHTPPETVEELIAPLLAGQSVGLMSEAGLPAVADPGALLVAAAHRHGVVVRPLVGPSSLMLTLMASGLNGQRFAFVGYLPVKPEERKRAIRQLEQRSRSEGQTQLFIEAPYRNAKLFDDLVRQCADSTLITVGCDLTLPDGFVRTQSAAQWRKQNAPSINKRNTVFALLAV